MRLRISDLGVLMVALLIIATIASIYVAFQTTAGIADMRREWNRFEAEAQHKEVLVRRLTADLGYGGMIHHFKNYVLRQDEPRIEKIRASVKDALVVISEYRTLPLNEAETSALTDIETVVKAYGSNLDKAIQMANEGKTPGEIDGAVKIDDGPALRGRATLNEAIDATIAENAAAIENVSAETETLAQIGAYVIAAGLFLVILTLSWFLTFRLVRPMKAMTSAMERLAQNDLDVAIPAADRKDELGDMAAAVEVFKRNANQIRQMENVADDIVKSIATAIEQVKEAINSQVATSSEQAAAVTQTTTSLEQIRETADSTASRADSLSNSAEQTLRAGESNRQDMNNVVEAMGSIREKVEAIAHTMVVLTEQTRRVGEITDSVGALAQQSKMLAINASIEAAKAGEAGQGFAVVAEEVASLAEQSEQATVQVRSVLDQIQAASEKAIFATEEGTKQVDSGVNLIQVVGEGMNSLLTVIDETVSATRQMVDAIRQQTAGVQQVTGAMGDISQGTTQVAQTSGQIRESVDSLAMDIDRLVDIRNA